MRFDVYEYTSQGGRAYNEDCLGSLFSEDGGIFAVADGLGGHLCGEKASYTAVSTIISGWDNSAEDISAQLKEKIMQANQNILALQKEMNAAMKTTVAALAVVGDKAYWANSGDTRVYFIHGRELHSCTNDHSVAFKKYKAFEISRNSIGSDEDQSMLLRSLGSADRYEPEMYSSDVSLKSGDAFLICTDGAWEYLKDGEIFIDLLKSDTAEQWTEYLLLRIMERLNGENDNLSILAVILN